MMDMVILDQTEHTSHTADDTGLFTVVDVATPYNMASYRLLCPAVVLTAAYSVALHLCRTFYLLNCKIVIVLLVIIFTERDSAALTVADITVLDDPTL